MSFIFVILVKLTIMVTKTISLPEEMIQWLKDRDMSISKVVQRHIRELMDKENARSDVPV